MIDIETKISPLIESQFPGIYRTDGPNLIAFVRAYYEWLEESGNALYYSRRLPEIGDIDQTLDEFLIHFKNTFLDGMPFATSLDKRLLVKHALDLYRSKGSPRSIELAFLLLYNETVEVELPSKLILKPSDSEYYLPVYLEVSGSHEKLEELVGREIFGSNSSALAFVEGIVTKTVAQKVISIVYLSNTRGSFETGELIVLSSGGTFVGAPIITGSLSDITIVLGGANSSIGDIYEVITTGGKQGLVRVTGVEDATGRVNFTLVDGGSGYTLTDDTQVLVSTAMLEADNKHNHEYYYSSASDVFTVGEIVEGSTSRATAIVVDDNGTRVIFRELDGTFVITETLTGLTSGETATLDTITDDFTRDFLRFETITQHIDDIDYISLQGATSLVVGDIITAERNGDEIEYNDVSALMTIFGATGTFTVTETITGALSGATAIVLADNGTNLELRLISGIFQNGEEVEGGASTETATGTFPVVLPFTLSETLNDTGSNTATVAFSNTTVAFVTPGVGTFAVGTRITGASSGISANVIVVASPAGEVANGVIVSVTTSNTSAGTFRVNTLEGEFTGIDDIFLRTDNLTYNSINANGSNTDFAVAEILEQSNTRTATTSSKVGTWSALDVVTGATSLATAEVITDGSTVTLNVLTGNLIEGETISDGGTPNTAIIDLLKTPQGVLKTTNGSLAKLQPTKATFEVGYRITGLSTGVTANVTVIATGQDYANAIPSLVTDNSVTANVIATNTTHVGAISNTQAFFSVTTLDENLTLIVGDDSGTVANVANIGLGSAASFEPGSLTDDEIISTYTDLLSGNNAVGIPYMDINIDGTGSGVGFVSSYNVDVAGTGYANGDAVVTLGGNPAVVSTGSVVTDGAGAITSVTLQEIGSGFFFDPNPINITTGGGSGATVTANPVFGYGFPKDIFAGFNDIINNALNVDVFTIGTIATLTKINPGSGYNLKPFVVVYMPFIAAFDKRDLVITYDTLVGSFNVGETISQNISLTGHEVNTDILSFTMPITAPSAVFSVNEIIEGDISNANATILVDNFAANGTLSVNNDIVGTFNSSELIWSHSNTVLATGLLSFITDEYTTGDLTFQAVVDLNVSDPSHHMVISAASGSYTINELITGDTSAATGIVIGGNTTLIVLRSVAGTFASENIYSATGTTLTTGDITFADNAPSANTIVRTSGSWIADGVAVNDLILIAGSASNDGLHLVTARTATTIDTTDNIADEGPTAATAAQRTTATGAATTTDLFVAGQDVIQASSGANAEVIFANSTIVKVASVVGAMADAQRVVAVGYDITPVTNVLQTGATITGGTSGATAEIITNEGGFLRLKYISAPFALGETISDGGTPNTATVDTISTLVASTLVDTSNTSANGMITRETSDWQTDDTFDTNIVFISGATNSTNNGKKIVIGSSAFSLNNTDDTIEISQTDVIQELSVAALAEGPDQVSRASGSWVTDGVISGQYVFTENAADSENDGTLLVVASNTTHLIIDSDSMVTAASDATANALIRTTANSSSFATVFQLGEGISQLGTGFTGNIANILGSLLTIDNQTGVFANNDEIVGLSSGVIANTDSVAATSIISLAKGRVNSIDAANNILFVKRTSFNTVFANTYDITGSNSGATANVVNVEKDFSTLPMGDNAAVDSSVQSANGVVTDVEVIDSGYGYEDEIDVTLVSENNAFIITGTANVTTQGIGTGYHRSVSSELNSGQHIHDNNFYQEYSYVIESGLSLDKYSDVVKRLFEVSGTKLFGEVQKTLTGNLNISVAESTVTVT